MSHNIPSHKLFALNELMATELFITSDQVGGTRAISYTSTAGPCIDTVYAFINKCQHAVDAGHLKIPLSDDTRVTAPSFNVTPYCWLLLATQIPPNTFVVLANQVGDAFPFAHLIGLVNHLPAGKTAEISERGCFLADLTSRNQTIQYLACSVASSMFMSGVMGGPYINDCFPDVLCELDHPVYGSFQQQRPWEFKHANFVSFMQKASYEQLSLVLAAVEGGDKGMVGADEKLGMLTEFCMDPVLSREAAFELVGEGGRFQGMGKGMMEELVGVYGVAPLLSVWLLVGNPCCRVTYMPMMVFDFSQQHYPELHVEYSWCKQVCLAAKSCDMFSRSLLLMVAAIYTPTTVVLPNGLPYSLSLNQMLALYMYGFNPFFSRFLAVSDSMLFWADPDNSLLVRTSPVMFMEQPLFLWKDVGVVMQYEMRVEVAKCYGEFLVSNCVIEQEDCDAFVDWIDEADFGMVSWMQELSQQRVVG